MASSKQWGAYLLRCSDDSLYAGVSNDMRARLKRHQAGIGSRYTRSRLPLTLVYWEPCLDRSAALQREAAIRRLSRAAKLAMLESWSASADFARNTFAFDTCDIALDK